MSDCLAVCLMQHTVSILFLQKLIGAFESLRFQAEADQQDMQKGLFLFVHHALLHNHFIHHFIWLSQTLFVITRKRTFNCIRGTLVDQHSTCAKSSQLSVLYCLFFQVKEKLLQFEDLKEKYHHDCKINEKEVSKMKIFSWFSFKILKQPQVDKMWKTIVSTGCRPSNKA